MLRSGENLKNYWGVSLCNFIVAAKFSLEREFSMSKERTIVFSDGSKGLEGDFPVAVIWKQKVKNPDDSEFVNDVVDPIFDQRIARNLFGRMMTLVEATCEQHKLKAVKDLFAKELGDWESDVYTSARELAQGGDSSENIYTKRSRSIATSTTGSEAIFTLTNS